MVNVKFTKVLVWIYILFSTYIAEITCPPTPLVYHLVPNTTSAIYGTVVLYTCEENYMKISESALMETKCLGSGF